MNQIMKWFDSNHLRPGPVKNRSKAFQDFAESVSADLPESAEKTAGLRKLLEAKDCFVRATVDNERINTEDEAPRQTPTDIPPTDSFNNAKRVRRNV